MAHGSGTLHSGLWNGVRNTTEPFDDTPNLLQDATNIVIPDPQSGSGAFGRPAFRRFYPRYDGVIPADSYPPYGQTISSVFYGTGQCIHADNTGRASFFFCGGVMYTTTYPYYVTKTNVASSVCIDVSSQIYVTQIGNTLVVTDSTFQPWTYNVLTGAVAMIDAFPAVNNLSTSATDNTKITVASHPVEYRATGGFCQRIIVPATSVALPAGTIPKNTWGAYRVTYAPNSAAFTITGASGNATGYATEALAIAGLNASVPAVPVSSSVWNEGYFTVQADVTHDFVAGTTPLILAGAYPPGHCQALNYYAGRAAPWIATGNPVVYSGAVFFIYAGGGTPDPTYSFSEQNRTILWSEPNDPLAGYQQTNYDNAWTLAQTSTDYIYALAASNLALYYFRAYSIGSIQGAPGVDFRNTATNDSVSFNIGSTSPASICQFGQYLYFADTFGRTYRYAYGSAPEKLWLQARAVYEDVGVPTAGSGGLAVSRAFIDPTLGVYVVFPFASTSGLALAYDAMTGRYLGRWSIAGGSSATDSIRVDACGTLYSFGDGGTVGAVLGSSDTTATAYGYLWGLLSLKWQANKWGDVPLWADSVAPSTTVGQVTSVKTNRLGYSTVNNYTLGQVRLVLDSNVASIPAAGVTSNITVTTPNGVYTDWAAVTAPDSYDGVNLATFLGSGQVTGRGIQVTAQNAQTAAQWVCYRVEADVVAGTAYPGER